MIKIFAYGSLRKTGVQIKLLGKQLDGTPDSILGWKAIYDVPLDGETYSRLVVERDGIVFGSIIELTPEEIKIIDEYETPYRRIPMKTKGGIEVETYFHSDWKATDGNVELKEKIKFINDIKNALVKNQDYENAARARDIEKYLLNE